MPVLPNEESMKALLDPSNTWSARPPARYLEYLRRNAKKANYFNAILQYIADYDAPLEARIECIIRLIDGGYGEADDQSQLILAGLGDELDEQHEAQGLVHPYCTFVSDASDPLCVTDPVESEDFALTPNDIRYYIEASINATPDLPEASRAMLLKQLHDMSDEKVLQLHKDGVFMVSEPVDFDQLSPSEKAKIVEMYPPVAENYMPPGPECPVITSSMAVTYTHWQLEELSSLPELSEEQLRRIKNRSLEDSKASASWFYHWHIQDALKLEPMEREYLFESLGWLFAPGMIEPITGPRLLLDRETIVCEGIKRLMPLLKPQELRDFLVQIRYDYNEDLGHENPEELKSIMESVTARYKQQFIQLLESLSDKAFDHIKPRLLDYLGEAPGISKKELTQKITEEHWCCGVPVLDFIRVLREAQRQDWLMEQPGYERQQLMRKAMENRCDLARGLPIFSETSTSNSYYKITGELQQSLLDIIDIFGEENQQLLVRQLTGYFNREVPNDKETLKYFASSIDPFDLSIMVRAILFSTSMTHNNYNELIRDVQNYIAEQSGYFNDQQKERAKYVSNYFGDHWYDPIRAYLLTKAIAENKPFPSCYLADRSESHYLIVKYRAIPDGSGLGEYHIYDPVEKSVLTIQDLGEGPEPVWIPEYTVFGQKMELYNGWFESEVVFLGERAFIWSNPAKPWQASFFLNKLVEIYDEENLPLIIDAINRLDLSIHCANDEKRKQKLEETANKVASPLLQVYQLLMNEVTLSDEEYAVQLSNHARYLPGTDKRRELLRTMPLILKDEKLLELVLKEAAEKQDSNSLFTLGAAALGAAGIGAFKMMTDNAKEEVQSPVLPRLTGETTPNTVKVKQ